LNAIPERARIKDRLTHLWNYERYTSPFKSGDKYYFSKNDGLQNQSVLYRSDTPTGPMELVLDPNTFSKDGTVALAGTSYADDGSRMAYGLSGSGSDWSEWHFRDLKSNQEMTDVLKWVKFSGVDWTKDGSGVFYSRYDQPDTAHAYISKNLNHKLYF